MEGIKKQLQKVRKQLALRAVAMGAASSKQEAEAKKVINSNKARVEEEKRKEAKRKNIKEMKRQAEKTKKKEVETLKEAEKIAAQAQTVNEAQRKVVEACKVEVECLTKVDRDNLSAEHVIKLEEKLTESMGMKKKIEEECNRDVKNKMGDKKQVVNRKILMTVRIVVLQMNPINRRGKIEIEKEVGETSKLLDILAQTNRILVWQVRAIAGTGDQNDRSF